MNLTLYTNGFFGSVLKSPTQMGSLSINNSVSNISRLGTFKLHVTWCAQLCSLAETPQLPPFPPRLDSYFEGSIDQQRKTTSICNPLINTVQVLHFQFSVQFKYLGKNFLLFV